MNIMASVSETLGSVGRLNTTRVRWTTWRERFCRPRSNRSPSSGDPMTATNGDHAAVVVTVEGPRR